MNDKKTQLYFLLALIVIVSILSFYIFRPFIYTLVLAAVFMVVFQPLQQRMLKLFKERAGIAAFCTTLLITIFIFTPLIFLGIQILKESRQLYFMIYQGSGKDVFIDFFNNLQIYLHNTFPGMQAYSFDFNTYMKQGLVWLVQNLGSIFSSLAAIVADFLIFLIALYFLFKDGPRFKKALLYLSPLDDKDDESVLVKLSLAVKSLINGRILIVLIQGAMTAAGLAVFGIPNAILWGSVAVISALIPTIGTALVIIPAVVYLFISGKIISAIILAAWGIGGVGLIDNLLGPKLMGKGIQVHSFIIFLAVLGGIIYFGPVGFLLGPLVVSMLFSLFDIYFSFINKNASIKKTKQN